MLLIPPAPPAGVDWTPRAIVYTSWPSRADPSDKHEVYSGIQRDMELEPAPSNRQDECPTNRQFRGLLLSTRLTAAARSPRMPNLFSNLRLSTCSEAVLQCRMLSHCADVTPIHNLAGLLMT